MISYGMVVKMDETLDSPLLPRWCCSKNVIVEYSSNFSCAASFVLQAQVNGFFQMERVC